MVVKIVKIHAPEYNIRQKPNYLKIGAKVDKIIEKEFLNGKYLIRAISSKDHPNLTVNKLINTIIKIGTDKYDSKRKAVCHDEFSCYDYDIQADSFEIKKSKIMIPNSHKYKTIFGDIIWHFYEHAPLDRGYSVKINLLLIFDLKQFNKAKKINSKIKGVRRGLNKYLYKFKDSKKKTDALIGIIKILK